MILIISLAKILFYASILGMLFLVLKKILENQEQRDKVVALLKESLNKVLELFKIFFKFIVKLYNFSLPKIKQIILIVFRKIKQLFFVTVKFISDKIASWKKELKPLHLPKEKKEFLSHLWEKVNQDKKTIPVFTQQQPKPIKQESSKDAHKPFIVEDPIKREILIKQEQSLLKLIVMRPKDVNLYKKLGIIYKELGVIEDARNCFNYALKLGAKDKEIQKELELLK